MEYHDAVFHNGIFYEASVAATAADSVSDVVVTQH